MPKALLPNPETPFHIYRASAGSGKTYKLAVSYLTLALAKPGAFRHVLGVTFTNKATEEMKARVLYFLRQLAAGEMPGLQTELANALQKSEQEVQNRAAHALSDILHQYGRFSVVTIDSFFHQVIRSFAREIGLQGSFSIELDTDKVMEEVIDQMLLEIGDEENKPLRDWLTRFAENRVEAGEAWDFRKDMGKLARQITQEGFRPHAEAVQRLNDDPKFFENLQNELYSVQTEFKSRVNQLCREAIRIMESRGISPDEFKGGSTQSPAVIFYNIETKNTPFEVTPAQRKKTHSTDWVKTKDPRSGLLIEAVDQGLLRLYVELIAYIDDHIIAYHSAREALRHLYTFGILTKLIEYLKKYRDEKDVILISDLPDFLHRIIRDSDTPYIYEKVGSIFSHYLIDEFQDTSAFQWENFRPLVKNAADSGQFSLVVGDVKQSIYRFRGGDWELLQERVKNEIGQELVFENTLQVNWRSAPRLVQFNNDLFTQLPAILRDQFNSQLHDVPDEGMREAISQQATHVFDTFRDVQQKPAKPHGDRPGHIRIQYINEADMEGEKWKEEATRRTIQTVEMMQRQGYQLRDIAVLARTTGEGQKIARAFIDHRNSELADSSLKYEVVSSEALLLASSHVVRLLVAAIRWLNDEKNDIALTEWLYEYHQYILKTDKPLSKLFEMSGDWRQHAPVGFVNQKNYLQTLPIYELVEHLVRLFILDQSRDEFAYLQGFQDAVLDYSKNERGDLPSFLSWWESQGSSRSIQLSDRNDAIKILTIHKAKGLEFPVVIVPFLSWSLDHENSWNRETIIWCKPPGQGPGRRLPTIPLRYGKALAQTYWAEDYYQEKLKVSLDSLNLLYVAFTRPVDALFAFGKLTSNGKISSVDDLVLNWLKTTPDWNETESSYQSGHLGQPEPPKNNLTEYGVKEYHTYPWRGKVSVQLKGSARLSGRKLGASQHGIAVHALMSRIRYPSDLEAIREHPAYEEAAALVHHPSVCEWFDPKWEVTTEVPILLPGGALKRIDRVNRLTDRTVVIDFKTGTKRPEDQEQVREYVQLMETMGLPGVDGYVIYLSDQGVIKV